MQSRWGFTLVGALLVGFALVGVASAQTTWQGPPGTPPNNNVPAPINVGNSIDVTTAPDQIRDGWLGLKNTAGSDNALSLIGNMIMSGSNRYLNFGTTWNSAGYGFRDNAGVLQFKNSGGTWANLGAGLWTAGTGGVIYYNGGNVGIGTASPAARLQFANLVDATPSNMNMIQFWADSAAGRQFGIGISSGQQNYRADGHVFFTPSSSPLERMRITSTGNVGIGTTNPAQKLEVNGAIRAVGQVQTTGPGGGFQMFNRATNLASSQWYSPTAGATRLFDHVAAVDRLTVDAAGNVGIGLTVPTQKLHVNGNVNVATGYCFMVNGTCISGSGPATETDTLDTVVTRGNNTGREIFVGTFRLGATPAGGADQFTLTNNNSSVTDHAYLYGYSTTNIGATLGAYIGGSAPGFRQLTLQGSNIILSPASSRGVGVFTGSPTANSLSIGTTGNTYQLCLNGTCTSSLTPTTSYWTFSSGNLDTASTITGRVGVLGRDSNGYALSLPNGGIWINSANINGDSIAANGGIATNEHIWAGGNADVVGRATAGYVVASGASAALYSNDRDGSGQVALYRDANINRLWSSGFGDVITFNDSGNVGIGDTNPAYKLEVAGDINIVSPGTCLRVNGTCITTGGGGVTQIVAGTNITISPVTGTGVVTVNASGGSAISGTATRVAKFATATTLGDSIITDNGTNVGIGTTNPTTKLQVCATPVCAAGNAIMIGNDAVFADMDTANTISLNGNSDATVGSLRLGSGGGTISGKSGKVGVGTNDPKTKLHVHSAGGTDQFWLSNTEGNAYLYAYSTGGTGATLGAWLGSGSAGTLNLNGSNVYVNNGIQFSPDQGGSIEIGAPQGSVGCGIPYIDFHGNGSGTDFNARIINDGIGRLTVPGNLRANAFIYNSDARLKKDIVSLSDSLQKVLQLMPVSFLWKDTSIYPAGAQIGFIAQDVENIIPEVVNTDEAGMKAIDYARFAPLLVGSVQELNAKIDAQQRQIDELKAQIEAITDR